MHTKSAIEAILFYSSKPQSLQELARLVQVSKDAVVEAAYELQKEYAEGKRGMRIVVSNTAAEMATAPECTGVIQKFEKEEEYTLTQAKIETLTLIAYMGPLEKVELEAIRGVNCSLILRNLLIDELIEEATQKETTHYSVSTNFLKHLGITTMIVLLDYNTFRKKILSEI